MGLRFVVPLLLVSCSLLVPFDDKAGSIGSDAAPVQDTGVGILDAGAGLDGAVVDAAVDAPAAPRFCSTVPATVAFCADFEDEPLKAGWTYDNADSPGTIERSTLRAAGGVASFRATRARIGANAAETNQSMVKVFPGWRVVHVEFEMYMVKPVWQSTDINTGLFGVMYNTGAALQGSSFSFGRSYVNLGWEPQGGPTGVATGPVLSTDKWVHVSLETDPVKATVKATIDGVPYLITGMPITGTNRDSGFHLGLVGYNRPAPAFDVFYDNVVITLP